MKRIKMNFVNPSMRLSTFKPGINKHELNPNQKSNIGSRSILSLQLIFFNGRLTYFLLVSLRISCHLSYVTLEFVRYLSTKCCTKSYLFNIYHAMFVSITGARRKTFPAKPSLVKVRSRVVIPIYLFSDI